MAEPKPPVAAELVWSRDLQLGATSGTTAVVVDGDSAAGPSPVQLLVIALAACMSIDVIDILRKGRHPLSGLRASIIATRAPDAPRRVLEVALTFHLRGAIPPAAIERAIALSREKYCSVWHSMREDIDLVTSYDLAS